MRWSGAEMVRSGNRAEEAEERLQMVDLQETVVQGWEGSREVPPVSLGNWGTLAILKAVALEKGPSRMKFELPGEFM